MNDKFKELILKQAENNFEKALAGEKLTKEELEVIIAANKIDEKKFDLAQILPMMFTFLGGIT